MKLDPVVREKHMFIDFSNLQKIESARHKTDQKGFIFPCKMDVYESFFTARQSGRLFFLLPTPNWIVFVQKHQLDLERGQPFIIHDFSKQKKHN